MRSVVPQAVETALAALSEDDLKCYQGDLERDGQFKLGEHVVTSAMVDIKPEQKKLSGRCGDCVSARISCESVGPHCALALLSGSRSVSADQVPKHRSPIVQ